MYVCHTRVPHVCATRVGCYDLLGRWVDRTSGSRVHDVGSTFTGSRVPGSKAPAPAPQYGSHVRVEEERRYGTAAHQRWWCGSQMGRCGSSGSSGVSASQRCSAASSFAHGAGAITCRGMGMYAEPVGC